MMPSAVPCQSWMRGAGSGISRVTGANDVSPFLCGMRHRSPRASHRLARERDAGFENIRIHRKQCLGHFSAARGSRHINTIRVRMIPVDRKVHHLDDPLGLTAAVVREGCRRTHVPTVRVLRDDHDEAILVRRRHNAAVLSFGKNTGGSTAPIVQENEDWRIRGQFVRHIDIHAEIGRHAARAPVRDQLERSRLRRQCCKKSETSGKQRTDAREFFVHAKCFLCLVAATSAKNPKAQAKETTAVANMAALDVMDEFLLYTRTWRGNTKRVGL